MTFGDRHVIIIRHRSMSSVAEDDEYWMGFALEEASMADLADEVPVGAVLVGGGRLLARSHNRVEETDDPTAHAEMLVIRSGVQLTGCRWLVDATLYVTLEPCAMCAGAIVLARLPRLVFGASDPKTGAAGSVMDIVRDKRLNHRVDLRGGVRAEESGELIRAFFSRIRAKATDSGP